jgi:hypothetical protein
MGDQNISYWQNAYYQRYLSDAKAQGITPVSQDEFNGSVGSGGDPNFEQQYSSFMSQQQQTSKANLATDQANLLTQIKNYTTQGNTTAAQAAITAFQSKYPSQDVSAYQSFIPAGAAGSSTTGTTTSGSTTQAAPIPAQPTLNTTTPQYQQVVDPGTAPVYNYTPDQTMNDITSQLSNLMNNPQSISPDSVQKWTDWLNTTNAASNQQADTRTNEQYSALGDLGSSANRSALAQAAVQRNLGYSNQALGLAQQDLTNQNSQTMQGISGLLNTENTALNQNNIGVNQQWQDYLTKLQNSNNVNNTAFTNQLGTQNTSNNATLQSWLGGINQNWNLQNTGVNSGNQLLSGLLSNNINNANTSNNNAYQTNQAQSLLNNASSANQQQWWQPLVNSLSGSAGQQLGNQAIGQSASTSNSGDASGLMSLISIL